MARFAALLLRENLSGPLCCEQPGQACCAAAERGCLRGIVGAASCAVHDHNPDTGKLNRHSSQCPSLWRFHSWERTLTNNKLGPEDKTVSLKAINRHRASSRGSRA